MKDRITVEVIFDDRVREVIVELIKWAASNGMGLDEAGELLSKLYSGSETIAN